MEYTEFNHLEDKEAVVTEIYERLIHELQKFGQLKIGPKKTSIHLGNRFVFAGVYTRKNYINLEVHLNHKLTSERVSKVEQASANRYHHTIKLTDPDEIDGELLFDPANPATERVLAQYASFVQTINEPPIFKGLETGDALRRRIGRVKLITDDNMGLEWMPDVEMPWRDEEKSTQVASR